ncbi:hypothetical protein Acaty_c2480 [Acidithiobacillus caldus ATCC 51756]|uniref:Uncharacterized protein n=1 Tax=Acidithiobacillus caldus (strain ATCC 51756 / DSM 8584 / KU) TaxID=637389 RepID=A0A059ZU48_ACICK|nr:hypothetical protein Acaty_c2480 [Acidithiobacillus caldus ATCC 51756]
MAVYPLEALAPACLSGSLARAFRLDPPQIWAATHLGTRRECGREHGRATPPARPAGAISGAASGGHQHHAHGCCHHPSPPGKGSHQFLPPLRSSRSRGTIPQAPGPLCRNFPGDGNLAQPLPCRPPSADSHGPAERPSVGILATGLWALPRPFCAVVARPADRGPDRPGRRRLRQARGGAGSGPGADQNRPSGPTGGSGRRAGVAPPTGRSSPVGIRLHPRWRGGPCPRRTQGAMGGLSGPAARPHTPPPRTRRRRMCRDPCCRLPLSAPFPRRDTTGRGAGHFSHRHPG